MPVSCVAVGCTSRWREDGEKCFYAFPSDESKRTTRLQAVRRVGFPPVTGIKSYHLVCSDHFVTGRVHHDADHVDYTPSVFSHKKPLVRKMSVIDRYRRAKTGMR